MAFENASYPDELNASSPNNTSDDPFGGNAIYLELQQQKNVWLNTFGNVSGAVTASDVELNYVDITTLGTAQASKALTVSAGNAVNAAIVTWTNAGIMTTVDINGGTVDAAAIGATTPAAGAFTTLSSSGLSTLASLTLTSGATVTAVLDEDAMGSDSATALATQQSIKAYVDSATSGGASTAYVDARARIVLNAIIADVGTGETVWVPVPVSGDIVRVDTVLEGALTGADATVTVKTAADATIAAIVITQSGSAAGDVDSNASPTNVAVTAGTAIKVVSDAASTGPQRVWVSITVDIS